MSERKRIITDYDSDSDHEHSSSKPDTSNKYTFYRDLFFDECIRNDNFERIKELKDSGTIRPRKDTCTELIIKSMNHKSKGCLMFFLKIYNEKFGSCDDFLIQYLADSNNIDMLIVVHQMCPNMNLNWNRHYAFIKFAEHGNIRALDYIRSKVPVDPRANRCKAFKNAIRVNNMEVFDYLYSMDTRIDLCSDENDLAYEAVRCESKIMVSHILDKTPNITNITVTFSKAAILGHKQIVEFIFNKYLSRNAVSKLYYHNLVKKLCKTKFVEIVRFIVSKIPVLNNREDMTSYFKIAVDYKMFQMEHELLRLNPGLIESEQSPLAKWVYSGGFEKETNDVVEENIENAKRRRLG